MISIVRESLYRDDKLFYMTYHVEINQPENVIEVIGINRPYPIYGEECEIMGYEDGEIEAVVRIKGDRMPSNLEFSRMLHQFLHENGFKWTSSLEQDILSEVVSVVTL